MESLSIARLDSISLALFAGDAPTNTQFEVIDLTAFVEWYWLKAAGHNLPDVDAIGTLQGVQRALRGRRESWVDSIAPRAGFIRVRRKHSDTENIAWLSFLAAFSRAAHAAGLAKSTSNQLAGVAKEMEDNIHWHSQRTRSGILIFVSREGMFEFAVVDSGVGVLASLRRAREFTDVVDHGTALQIAIGTGNSRFGTTVGRGWGFADLTVGIANQNAVVRFRSGDHLLELDGSDHGPLRSRRVQRASGTGFLITTRVRA
jgi:hypothetical protein